jgi:hypothetical protein
MFIYKINIQSGNYLQHNYYVSDLIDRRINFDQWEFCVAWATRISSLAVLSAVPPFLSHARKSKPAERRDRSQSISSETLLPISQRNAFAGNVQVLLVFLR